MASSPPSLPVIIEQSEQVARYITDDLTHIVNEAHINLMQEFQIHDGYFAHTSNATNATQQMAEVIKMLSDDLMHMMRDELIVGLHILLSDSEMDKGTNAYRAHYHVHYEIDIQSNNTVRPVNIVRVGGLVSIPQRVAQGARFDLLIDWSTSAQGQQENICRPNYWFDWVTEEEYLDAIGMEQYQEGRVEDGTQIIVVRTEGIPPEHYQDIR